MHKSHLADKLKQNNATLSVTRDEAVTEQGITIRKLALATSKSKELQKNIESDISAKYQNRKVNIMGGVQSVWNVINQTQILAQIFVFLFFHTIFHCIVLLIYSHQM